MRTVKTASGATAVQIVYSKRRGARRMEHLGSAHDEQELEALKAAARQRLAGRQRELELGVGLADEAGSNAVAGPGPLPIVAPDHRVRRECTNLARVGSKGRHGWSPSVVRFEKGFHPVRVS